MQVGITFTMNDTFPRLEDGPNQKLACNLLLVIINSRATPM